MSLPLPTDTEIKHIISAFYPEAQDIRHIEHGYENYIVVVDNRYVIRFPRNRTVWNRTKLERFVLSKLDLPVVPKIVHYNESPPYIVQTFLPGSHISEKEFRQLPAATQRILGSQIAEFAYKMHAALDVEKFKEQYEKLNLEEDSGGPYGDYLQKTLQDYTFPTDAQDKIAKQYFAAWKSIKPSKPVVVHDDLHIHNLLINKGHLSGVVDFGAVCIGTAEQELRQVYRLSDEALTSAIKTYNSLAHTEVDIETARTWATTQELATYADELQAGRTTSEKYKRARDHLILWFPGVF